MMYYYAKLNRKCENAIVFSVILAISMCTWIHDG